MTQQSAFVNKDGVMKIKVGLTTSFFFWRSYLWNQKANKEAIFLASMRYYLDMMPKVANVRATIFLHSSNICKCQNALPVQQWLDSLNICLSN